MYKVWLRLSRIVFDLGFLILFPHKLINNLVTVLQKCWLIRTALKNRPNKSYLICWAPAPSALPCWMAGGAGAPAAQHYRCPRPAVRPAASLSLEAAARTQTRWFLSQFPVSRQPRPWQERFYFAPGLLPVWQARCQCRLQPFAICDLLRFLLHFLSIRIITFVICWKIPMQYFWNVSIYSKVKRTTENIDQLVTKKLFLNFLVSFFLLFSPSNKNFLGRFVFRQEIN